jgi:FtsH-binding integral membrane protein
MEMIGYVLAGVGGLLIFVGLIWFLVRAFQQSILWGLGCMFVPFVGLFFLVIHWNRAGKPFMLSLLGVILEIVGLVMSGVSLSTITPPV